jgi:hypothetical protein
MSVPQPPKPAKLVVGIILRDKKQIDSIAGELIGKFGPVDVVSPWLSFGFTHYYEKEMGDCLARRMFSFAPLIEQESLADIKLHTNAIEAGYSSAGNRSVNIDPGYLLLERFVLATGKNFSHRIFIGKGIYADLTLIYSRGGYQPLPWTYPDYAGENIRGFLKKVREKYRIDTLSKRK